MMTSGLSALIFLATAIIAYAGVFTALAGYRQIPWQTFWSGSAAVMLPWLVATLVVGIASIFVPARLQTGAGMAAMFPALVFMLTVVAAPVVNLIASGNVDLEQRIKWFGGVSAVPAALMCGFLIFIMINDSLKGSGG
ncbi:MAG: hypothetical protein R3E87_19680 [Burkholderiaceae bacterium]